jgi:hypothetical protein
MAALRRATKRSPQKSALTSVYLAMVAAGRVAPQPQLRALLVKKSSKSQSGVLVRPSHASCNSVRFAAQSRAHAAFML